MYLPPDFLVPVPCPYRHFFGPLITLLGLFFTVEPDAVTVISTLLTRSRLSESSVCMYWVTNLYT